MDKHCRVTSDTNAMEIQEAQAMSISDLESLNAATQAVQWFLDETADCLNTMHVAFQAEHDSEHHYMAAWLSDLMKVDCYRDFKQLSNQSCVEWITFSMAADNYSPDDIRTALRLIGDNPLQIDWSDV